MTPTTRAPATLTVLFDDRCAVCRRAQAWLAHQPSYVPLVCLAASSAQAQHRFGHLPALGDELVVVSDSGEVWIGPPAFLVCLWALRDWRSWSYRLSTPALAPHAERFFMELSRRRGVFQSGAPCVDEVCTSASG